MAKKNEQIIYICELYRFGYDLRVAGNSEEEVRNAMIKEYVKTYKKYNGTDPKKDEDRYGDTYYDAMLNDLNIYKVTLGKVEWE